MSTFSETSEAPLARLCSRQGCKRDALHTLTYVYADSTAVIGPLAVHDEPHAYDLCAEHASRLTAPRGWEILRLDAQESVEDTRAAFHASVTPLPVERVEVSEEEVDTPDLSTEILTVADDGHSYAEDITADQPKGMRLPHLRRRTKRHS